ncbi:hypothetical protein OG589_14545 [Sphaerisporangium sp. NBC_01403]|uniref:hypothetical protein n=1 Tax=Sphaerisporangium sp. NBC_01403 TaxID=2903599 RepID=UPI00324462D4
MALEFVTEPEGETNYVTATARLCLTEDDRLVKDTDPDARWLYCVPGARISRKDAERYGLLDSESDQEADPDADGKADSPAPNKARPTPPNKARSRPADK